MEDIINDIPSVSLDNRFDVIDTLNTITDDVVSAINENESITKENINLINVAIEQLCNVIDITYTPSVSLESYNQSTASLALEGFKELAIKAWNKLLEWIHNFFEWLGTLYNKIFYSAESLNAKARKLKIKFNNLTDGPKEKIIDNKYLHNNLSINNAFPLHIVSDLQTYITVVSNTLDATIKRASLFRTIIKDYYVLSGPNQSINLGSFYDFTIDPSMINSISIPGNPVDFNLTNLPDSLSVVKSTQLFGNKVIMAITPKVRLTGDDAFDVIRFINCRLVDDPTPATNDSIKVNIATPREISYLLDGVITITYKLIQYKNKEKEYSNMRREFSKTIRSIKFIEALGGVRDTGNDEKLNEVIPKVRKLTQFLTRLLDEPNTSVSIHAIRTSKALLSYVEKSAEQYTVESVYQNNATAMLVV